MKYFVVFLCLMAYRITANISGLIRTNFYEKKYKKFLSSKSTSFTENISSVARLFKDADVSDHLIPHSERVGYGVVHNGYASLFENMVNLRQDVVAMMLLCFSEAKGTYKRRILEAFSPMFWTRCLVYLPRTILKFLGVTGDSVIIKIAQLLYWFVVPLLIAFREQLYQYAISLLG